MKPVPPIHRARGVAAPDARLPFWAAATALLLFGVYAVLACRDYYWGDSVELVYIARTLGIAHSSGYPLYTLLAAAAVRLPFADAWELSLLSALCASAAGFVLVRILARVGTPALLAAAGALFIGLGAALVDQATVPEVYALHWLLVLAVLDRLLIWRASGLRRDWIVLWFLYGLALANHLTALWLLPSLLLVVLSERGRPAGWRNWGAAALALAAGLLPYLYLPVRAFMEPLWNQGDPVTPARFLNHLSGTDFRYRQFSLSREELVEQVRLWAASLVAQWTWVPLLGLPAGLWAVYKKLGRSLMAALLLWLLIGLIYVWNYYIPDKQGYYLVVHSLTGLIMAAGAVEMVRRLTARWKRGHAVLTVTFLLAALLPLARLPAMYRADQSSLRDFLLDLWRDLPAGTVLITEDLSLHYGTLLLVQDGALALDRIVVSEYLLAFDWYQRFLARRFPALALPGDFPRLAEAFKKIGRGLSGPETGRRRQEQVEELAARLIEANRPQRTLALYLVGDEEERLSWGRFQLQNAGLVYTVAEGAPAATAVVDCDYSERYLAGKGSFSDPNEQSVAARYATACNRLGIARVKQERIPEALAAFERALRYDPDYVQAMKNLGYVLIARRAEEAAGARIWRRYVELAGAGADPAVVRWLSEHAKRGGDGQ